MKKSFLMAAAAAALLAGAAEAGTISIVSVTGNWTGVTGGTNVNGLGTGTVKWGTNIGNGQSGYGFAGYAPSGPHAADTLFDIGLFTHFNKAIASGTSITGAVLDVAFTFTIDGGAAITRHSIFEFAHWETANGANPCANGGANGSGVNANGCADRVTPVTNPYFSEAFLIDGVKYVFDVTGFNFGSSFWTREGATNSAVLQGRFTETNIAPVPLPAAGLMLLAGIAGLGAAARRRTAA